MRKRGFCSSVSGAQHYAETEELPLIIIIFKLNVIILLITAVSNESNTLHDCEAEAWIRLGL